VCLQSIFSHTENKTSSNLVLSPVADIESQIKDIQDKKRQAQAQEEKQKGIGLLESGYFDSEIYEGGQKGKYEGYVTSIATNEEDEDDDDEPIRPDKKSSAFNAPISFIKEITRVSPVVCKQMRAVSNFHPFNLQNEPEYDPFEDRRQKTVGEKEDEYRQRRRKLVISPERVDPFADGKCHLHSTPFNLSSL
jgi:splicing factor 3B subunit 1